MPRDDMNTMARFLAAHPEPAQLALRLGEAS